MGNFTIEKIRKITSPGAILNLGLGAITFELTYIASLIERTVCGSGFEKIAALRMISPALEHTLMSFVILVGGVLMLYRVEKS